MPISCHYTSLQPFPTKPRQPLIYSIDLPVLDISYKLNHIKCCLLWLISFVSLILLNFIHIVFCITSLFILLMSNIPLNEYTAICLSIQHLVDICIVSSFWLLWKKLLWTFWVWDLVQMYIFISFQEISEELLSDMVEISTTSDM